MRSCFMFGHADCPDNMLPKIEREIEKLCSMGVTDYYVGNRGRFDSLAAVAAKRIKQHHSDLKLFLVLAYHPGEQKVDLGDGFDGSYYPPLEGTPRQYSIVKANRYMVDNSDCSICYVKHIGNTRKLLEYAQRRNIYIVNIADAF